jgi:hypothetical protein
LQLVAVRPDQRQLHQLQLGAAEVEVEVEGEHGAGPAPERDIGLVLQQHHGPAGIASSWHHNNHFSSVDIVALRTPRQ